MLEIRIGYGDVVSGQMGIPMSASDFEAAKKILDEGKNGNQPVTVRSLVSPVQPLSEMITGMDYGDETMRKELDFLGSRLRHMTRKGQDIFSVALKLETPGTLKEIINLSYNLDSYDLLEDISDPGRIAAELLRRGKQIEIPEVLYPMLDFERIRDSYFADHVFHLTDKQKELAKNYAENLTAFFGTASSGIVAAINLSDEVLSYRPAVERAAAKYGMSDYVDLILAVMMQESGGRGPDVMQAAEGGFNTRYPHVPNGITDPEYSIECGVQELKYALDKAGCTGPTDLDRIKLALQGYNYGSAYIDWAMERDGGYTKENAIAYSDMMCARPSWPYDRYGDKEYVDHVLRYYQITASGGSYPANGMQIPHYLQTDYGNIPYGGGSIASSGCGPTSFAMIASYLTGTTITPIDAISWCGNSYYKPGVGTYWSYFQAASDHFGCGAVTQTSDPNQVLQALSEGHPVISSQRAGLFTSGGHFIVLRGVTAGGKVLVNDPNDSSSKNYINREFDMMTEVHATANAYWIFAKK